MKKNYLGQTSLKRLIDFIKGDLAEKVNTKDDITEDKTIEIWNSITGAEIPNANSLVHDHDERYYLRNEINSIIESLSPLHHTHNVSEVSGVVPNTLKVNNKALNTDIALTAEDIGADPAGSAENVQTNLTAHANDQSNPHGVTCEQIEALPLAGGTMTGTIVSSLNDSSKPEFQTDFNSSLLKLYIDNKKASIKFGTEDSVAPEENSRMIIRGLQNPIDPSDGVNKEYVDSAILRFGICDTAADVAEKVVTIPNITIKNGTRIIVYFTNENTNTSPTLNVNGSGPLPMKYETGHFTNSPIAIVSNFLTGLNEFVYINIGDKNYWYRSGYNEKAYSATRLNTARYIDGISFNGTADIHHLGTCSTTADTVTKEVTLAGFKKADGARVSVFFSYNNTASNAKLDVNGTGAYAIVNEKGFWPNHNNLWGANEIVDFVYYQSHWILVSNTAHALKKSVNFLTNLASTSSASFNGTASCTHGVTGTLPIANGGTGNTNGSAVKLTTARTISLTSDVTGSTTFDGSANKSIACTLANSGVTANTYGCDVTKMAIDRWCSNNRGLHSTTATSTWTLKQDLTVQFTYTVSSESVSYDYLNITAGGTQILANTGGDKATGTLSKALKSGQTIVFTYRKDGSGNKNDDCAIISAVKVTPTGGSATAVTTNNINSYFTITDGAYAFLPLIELLPKTTTAGSSTTGSNSFTLPTVTVDSKGRVTSASRVLIMPLGGNAETATKLATARTIRTNLASTSSASFDGSASITPGVTGTLPIANGGTGATTAAAARTALGISSTTMTRSQIEQKLVCTGGSYIDTVAIGYNALSANTSSSGNTAIGRGTLAKNKTGNYNTALGYCALTSTTSYSYSTGLGFNSSVTGNNQVQLGDADSTVYSQRSMSTRSDRRDKIDITDSNLGLNFIMGLRPVSYRMNPRESYFSNIDEEIVEEKDDDGNVTSTYTREIINNQKIDYSAFNDGSKARKRPHYGLIAQEVKEVMDDLGVDFAGYLDASYDGGEDVLSLSYTEFIAPMIKAIQEQQEMINDLKREVELLKA